MSINYDLFSGPSADTVTDPQQLFQALPGRSKKYAYLRDVQGEVLSKWHEAPDQRDTVVKMNTGGGKTVVGLLALKSCLNGGVGPAVYVAPDHYLCDQVIAEAAALGLSVTEDPRAIDYRSGRAILVIPIHTLINGLSKFGVGDDLRIEIGSIVIDDAHACLSAAEEQFTLTLPRSHPAYERFLQLFREDLRSQSPTTTIELEANDPRGLVNVPYWAWIDKQDSVIRILADYRDDDAVKFVRPLLRDELGHCRCIFTSPKLEISSRCLPIEAIPSFVNARRRIYMTATLADDAVLVTDFGADPTAVQNPITPRTASDLGERMILIPQSINTDLTDEAIRDFIAQYRRHHNVVVIVPSKKRAQFWKDVAGPDLILTAENMRSGIERLRSTVGNLAVMVNKYDGVDLPDDACRILVVDDLPDTRRLADRYEQSVLRASEREQVRQVQRIEQGMGRAIRSNEDYCVVVLMGQRLIGHLYASGAARHFSPAASRQLRLSEKLAEQVTNQGLSALAAPIQDLLDRNPQWVAAARRSLIDVSYSADRPLDQIAVGQREAYDAARRGRGDLAEARLRAAAESAPDRITKGWLLEQVAAVVHPTDAGRSQTILLAANDCNSRVTKPIAGITYQRLNTAGMDQARQAALYFERYPDPNELVIGINAILADLIFQEETAEPFEQALMELGLHLGFRSQRPEKDGAGNLDVLWGLGDSRYLLLPCKNGAQTDSIAKRYTDEVSGNLTWFRAHYDAAARPIVAMVHPSRDLDAAATAPPEMRIITERELGKLRDAVRSFSTAVKDQRADPAQIRRALSMAGLLGTQITDNFTVASRGARSRA